MYKMLSFAFNSAKFKQAKEFISSISIALIIALLIRSILFEPFSIPSGSMKPNFLVGDYLFVSKYYYGISKHSFPFSPDLFEGRKLALHKPSRGDVVVFRIPSNTDIYYIKRLIGLPGDKIQMRNGTLHINAEPYKEDFAGTFTDSDGRIINQKIETAANGVSYLILDENPYGALDNTDVYTVPEGHYFLMGDNRDSSVDSRVINGPVGYLPEEYIIGKATFILFSNPEPIWKIWKWLISFDLHRLFVKVNP